jgi:hypothetical protein
VLQGRGGRRRPPAVTRAGIALRPTRRRDARTISVGCSRSHGRGRGAHRQRDPRGRQGARSSAATAVAAARSPRGQAPRDARDSASGQRARAGRGTDNPQRDRARRPPAHCGRQCCESADRLEATMGWGDRRGDRLTCRDHAADEVTGAEPDPAHGVRSGRRKHRPAVSWPRRCRTGQRPYRRAATVRDGNRGPSRSPEKTAAKQERAAT